jgi:hypothetical protein
LSKKFRKELLVYSRNVVKFSIDILTKICEEHLRYPELKIRDLITDMNVPHPYTNVTRLKITKVKLTPNPRFSPEINSEFELSSTTSRGVLKGKSNNNDEDPLFEESTGEYPFNYNDTLVFSDSTTMIFNIPRVGYVICAILVGNKTQELIDVTSI